MEILFVSHKYPPAVGGMEKQSFELINGMKQFARVHSLVYTGKENRLLFFLSLEKRIAAFLRQFPAISIIHFNDALIASVCLRHKSYAHLYRAVTVHGLDVVFPSGIYQKFILPAFNSFDLIIAVSQATAAACIERGIREDKVTVIQNGVSHELLNIKPPPDFFQRFEAQYGINLAGKTVLTALGRPVKRKGFSWFLTHVVPRLKGNFIFLMIGPFHTSRPRTDFLFPLLPAGIRTRIALLLGYPTDEHPIRKLLRQERFQNKAVHLGKLPFGDLMGVLASSHAFVMPNIYVKGDMEGFGLVCLEASLTGAWVFAAQIDGITDAIHQDQNGTLLPAGDDETWTRTLNAFITDPSKFHVSKESSRLYTAAHFSWNQMTRAYWDHFRKMQ